jgi:hypothetical protein
MSFVSSFLQLLWLKMVYHREASRKIGKLATHLWLF